MWVIFGCLGVLTIWADFVIWNMLRNASPFNRENRFNEAAWNAIFQTLVSVILIPIWAALNIGILTLFGTGAFLLARWVIMILGVEL